MNTPITPDGVWQKIKEEFLHDKRIYQFPISDGIGANTSERLNCSSSDTCNLCNSSTDVPLPEYFSRMFRSEAERGALQGELYKFLENNKYKAITEYQIKCLSHKSVGQGDIAVFSNLNNTYPEIVMELKHYSSFQGPPSVFATQKYRASKITPASNKLFSQLGRWKAHVNPHPFESSCHAQLNSIRSMWIGFYTEFGIAATPTINGYSFIKSYEGLLDSYLSRKKSFKHKFECSSQSSDWLCPQKLIDNFCSAVHSNLPNGDSCDSVRFGYGFIDQEILISGTPHTGRLHCFAVWRNK